VLLGKEEGVKKVERQSCPLVQKKHVGMTGKKVLAGEGLQKRHTIWTPQPKTKSKRKKLKWASIA